MKQIRNFILVVLGVLLVILMVQNAQPVTFRFLNWRYQVSQLLLVVIVAVIGFLGGYGVAKLTGRSGSDKEP